MTKSDIKTVSGLHEVKFEGFATHAEKVIFDDFARSIPTPKNRVIHLERPMFVDTAQVKYRRGFAIGLECDASSPVDEREVLSKIRGLIIKHNLAPLIRVGNTDYIHIYNVYMRS